MKEKGGKKSPLGRVKNASQVTVDIFSEIRMHIEIDDDIIHFLWSRN